MFSRAISLISGLTIGQWLMIAAGALIAIQFVTIRVQKTRYVALQKEHALIVQGVRAAGQLQIQQARAENKVREGIIQRLEKNHAVIVQSLIDQLNDALKRVSNKSPSSSGVPPLSDAAKRIGCPSASAELAGRLERLEIGVLTRLVGVGNGALARSAFCKQYLDEQTAVAK